jgi:hypothetical protein
MSHSTTNIDLKKEQGVFESKGETTTKVLRYFASRSKRETRLKQMSACLFKLGLRSAKGGAPNPLAYAIGSNNRAARLHMIVCAQEYGDPM